MNQKILSLITCVLFSFVAMAQMTIKGKVTSAEDGMGLPGVNVVEKANPTNGAATDIDGNYTLTVKNKSSIVVFSSIGMKTVEIPASKAGNLVMQSNSEILGEVVVTALGISREKKALGYAVSEIGGDELSAVKESNPANSLTGKVAGVVVTQSGAGIGSGSRITIRGNNSINANNQPLIVVDGIPIDNTGANSGGDVYQSRVSGGGISDINPDDIESISVLKGPNAAALYGSRAGNGVVLITTKKGTTQKGIGVSINSNLTFENPMEFPEYQNQYGQGTNGNIPADLVGLKNASGSWGPKFDGSEQLYFTGQTRPYVAQEDNVKNFFRTGTRFVNSVALDGGGEEYTIRFSYTNNNNRSMLPNADLTSHNFNLRGFAKLNEKLNIDAKATYFFQDINNQPSIGSQGIMAFLLGMPRNIALSDLKKYQNLDEGYSSISYSSLGANPYWMQYHDTYKDRRERFLGFAKLSYQFNDYLSAFARIGTDVTTTKTENVHQYGHHYKKTGYLWFGESRSTETNADFLLMFNKDLNEDFNLSANLGINHSYRTYESSSISGENFKIPTRATVANLGKINTPGYTPLQEKKVNSVYASTSLAYRNYLFLDVTARNDWSSTLPKENRSYFYPSISASGVLSQAFELPKWVNFLKIRGSWAQVGNDTSPYQINNYFTIAGDGYLGVTQVSRTDVKFNPNLKPERITSSELGIEFKLFNNRVYGDFSVYNILTKDLIFDVDIPKSTGYSKERVNIGEMQNKGIELTFGGIPVQTDNFSWDVALNFSKNKNTLNSLTKALKSHVLNETNSGGVAIQATVGGGYGDIYGTDWKRNDNGDIVLNAEGKPLASSEKVFLGNAQPDWIGGITNTFTYKNIALRIFIDGRIGGKVYSGTGASLDASGVSKRSLEYRDGGILVKGVIENKDGSYSTNDKIISAEKYWGSYSSIASNYIYDQTNIRLRELALSYQLPKNLLKKTFIREASISLVGRNLFFLYKDLDHFDPEASLGTSNAGQGILYYNLPSSRVLGMNLNIKF